MELYTPDQWDRHGLGRELQFFSTDNEMARYLGDLPQQLGPYTILGARPVLVTGGYQQQRFAGPLHDWLKAMTEGEQGTPTDFWVRAAAIMPDIPAMVVEVDKWCAVNGFILVQHGAQRKNKRLVSRIAIVNKIIETATRKVVRMEPQQRLFEVLTSRIQRDLKYTTIHVFKDGHEEESHLPLMTAAAASLALSGFFSEKAGRPIK